MARQQALRAPERQRYEATRPDGSCELADAGDGIDLVSPHDVTTPHEIEALVSERQPAKISLAKLEARGKAALFAGFASTVQEFASDVHSNDMPGLCHSMCQLHRIRTDAASCVEPPGSPGNAKLSNGRADGGLR